jgi:exodeoxyribonuclease V alpha subunit
MTELITEVKRVPFDKESGSGHWCIIVTDAGTVTGEIRWIPKQGERIKLQGEWTVRNGERQFKFAHAMPDIPDNPRAKLHYVCKMATGFGDALEERIWEAYGENWIHIESGGVKGISAAKYKSFIDATALLDQSQDYIEALTWMLHIGMTHNMADAAFERWEKDTIAVVQNDPYELAMLPNYGFKDADKLRAEFLIDDDDERRIRAAIMYVIQAAQRDGDTIISWDVIALQFRQLIGTTDKYKKLLVKVAREMMIESQELKGWSETRMVSTSASYDDEVAILDFASSNGKG